MKRVNAFAPAGAVGGLQLVARPLSSWGAPRPGRISILAGLRTASSFPRRDRAIRPANPLRLGVLSIGAVTSCAAHASSLGASSGVDAGPAWGDQREREAQAAPPPRAAGACRPIGGLSEVAHLYRGFVVDLWGCLHDGVKPFETVPECLARMREDGRQLLFVSNSTQPRESISRHLVKMGIVVPPEEVLTSGDVVREQLARPADPVFLQSARRVFHLARPEMGRGGRGHGMVEGPLAAPVELVDSVADATLVLLSYFGDEDEDHAPVLAALQEAQRRGLPVVCTNPDRLSYNGDKKRFPAGHYAALYERMGGRAVYYGKPHAPIYAAALRRLRARGVPDPSAVLAVGDSLETDVAGGATQGMAGLLLACGVHQDVLRPAPDFSTFDAAAARPLCERHGVWPEYLLPVLRW
eukprot:tig00020927_g15946.t1